MFVLGLGFGVLCFGFGILELVILNLVFWGWDLKFGVCNFGVWVFKFAVLVLGFGVWFLRVEILEFWYLSLGFLFWDLDFGDLALRFRIW